MWRRREWIPRNSMPAGVAPRVADAPAWVAQPLRRVRHQHGAQPGAHHRRFRARTASGRRAVVICIAARSDTATLSPQRTECGDGRPPARAGGRGLRGPTIGRTRLRQAVERLRRDRDAPRGGDVDRIGLEALACGVPLLTLRTTAGAARKKTAACRSTPPQRHRGPGTSAALRRSGHNRRRPRPPRERRVAPRARAPSPAWRTPRRVHWSVLDEAEQGQAFATLESR